jgi:hypothetical protein
VATKHRVTESRSRRFRDQHGHAFETWPHLLEQLQALAVKVGGQIGDAGKIGARMIEACYEARPYRVADGKDDRNVPCKLLEEKGHRGPVHEDNVGPGLDNRSRGLRSLFLGQVMQFDGRESEVAAFHEPMLPEQWRPDGPKSRGVAIVA